MHTYRILALALLLIAPLCHGQFLIGQTAGFTGPVGAGVKETTSGAKLWLDHINARGGVHGEKIELISLDDKFDPKTAGENARVLIEEKQVVAMFLTRGTPHSQAVIPHLDKHGVALIGPSTGAMLLHTPVQKHVFNVRATYQAEARKAVNHSATLGLTRIAVVHVNDSFGLDALAGAQLGFTDVKQKPMTIEKYDRSKPNLAPIVPKVKDAQAVFVFGSGQQVAELVAALRAAGSAAQIITLSNNASGGFVKQLGANSRGVVVTQVFPNERTLSVKMVQEAAELAKGAKLELSPALLEGYAAAKVLVESLRRMPPRAKGETVAATRAKVLASVGGLKNYDLGGLEVSFSDTDHTGLDFTDLSIIDAQGRFRR